VPASRFPAFLLNGPAVLLPVLPIASENGYWVALLRGAARPLKQKAKRRMAIDKVPQFDNKPPLAGGIKVPPSMRCPRLMLINSASL
jgi:hypothetical protein